MRLLPAQVEILLAAGDVAGARAALDELSGTIAEYPSPALDGRRHAAAGRVLLAEGDAAGAAKELRAANKDWQEVGAPYEVARVRAVLALALRALGDDEAAYLELRAALEEFQRLGAALDATAAERLLAEADDRRSAPEQVRRTFMFTDIVGSTTLAEALGDAAWERLLRWHDDTLRRLIATGGGDVVNSTGDGFFAAFPSARRAVDCAVAIQRALRDQQDVDRVRAADPDRDPCGRGARDVARTSAGSASTWRPGSGRSPAPGRSWRPSRRSRRPASPWRRTRARSRSRA